jgi:hypothetical protein
MGIQVLAAVCVRGDFWRSFSPNGAPAPSGRQRERPGPGEKSLPQG